jgi:hypothetical protein
MKKANMAPLSANSETPPSCRQRDPRILVACRQSRKEEGAASENIESKSEDRCAFPQLLSIPDPGSPPGASKFRLQPRPRHRPQPRREEFIPKRLRFDPFVASENNESKSEARQAFPQLLSIPDPGSPPGASKFRLQPRPRHRPQPRREEFIPKRLRVDPFVSLDKDTRTLPSLGVDSDGNLSCSENKIFMEEFLFDIDQEPGRLNTHDEETSTVRLSKPEALRRPISTKRDSCLDNMDPYTNLLMSMSSAFSTRNPEASNKK